MAADAETQDQGRLSNNLKLFDVYAMATGAMFSSGLLLLPGIAAADTGNQVARPQGQVAARDG